MDKELKITFLKRKEIDVEKWDELIAASLAETLYPYSWYLDATAENWSALVMGDYRFIMPLVWKKKYHIRYLYQPVYSQQLGVFGKEYITPLIIRKFIDYGIKKYKFGVVNFNVKNMIGEDPDFEIYERINYILPLHKSYEDLIKSYKSNASRNLKQSQIHNAKLDKFVSVDDLVSLKREHDLEKKSEAEYQRMKSIFETVMNQNKGHIYGIRDEGKLLAAAFFAFSKTRIIYLMSISSSQGKEQRAMFRIVDEFIRAYAGSDLLLDFEGSNIPSIARFFGGFGGKPEVYQSLSFNRLPTPLFLSKRYG